MKILSASGLTEIPTDQRLWLVEDFRDSVAGSPEGVEIPT